MPVALPDNHGMAVLALTVLALVLFSRDRIPLETSCIAVLGLLVLGFELVPYYHDGVRLEPVEFFAGFGHEALITIGALMVAGKALETTGALQPLAVLMARGWSARPKLSLLLMLIVCAVLSAFLNNTPIVVMLLPVLISVSLRSRIPSSGMLLPMGLATLVGGMGTTIGTSTNLLVVSVAAQQGATRFDMFDFTLPAVIVGSVGILFLWLVAPRLLPVREPPLTDTSPRIFKATFFVTADSYPAGKTLAEVRARTEQRMSIDRVQRGDGLMVAKLPSMVFQEGDRLLVSDTRENLKEFERVLGVSMHDDSEMAVANPDEPVDSRGAQQLAEVVVTTGSPLHRRTLNTARFRARYKLLPMAIHRARTDAPGEVSGDFENVLLRAGDVILVQGTGEDLRSLKTSGTMLVLDGTMDLPHTHRAPRAIGIMLAVVALAATGIMPIAISALCGAALMILTRCLTWRDVVNSLSAPVIMIIVVSLALGHAILNTDVDEFLASLFVVGVGQMATPVALSVLMLVVAVLTNVVSNNAAAVIGTPIAISIANQLGLPVQPFVLAVLFGANMSFATPIGYKTNLLVFSAGGYKFSDFLRVGIPLTLIMWIGFSVVLTWLYEI